MALLWDPSKPLVMRKLQLLALCLTSAAAGGFTSTSSASSPSLDRPFAESFSRLDHAACVTLYHRNGRTGCGTVDHSLSIGQLQYFDGSELPDTNDPYVAVMEDHNLKMNPINMLANEYVATGLLQGVLVLNSTADGADEEDVSWYSPEPSNPQGYGTPSEDLTYGNNQYSWNRLGTGIIHVDLYGLPMAFVRDSSVSEALRNEAQDSSSNSENSIVAEFNYYMGPEEMNSKKCLAWEDAVDDKWRPKCLPLGGSSVWAAAGPPPGAKKEDEDDVQAKPVILVGAGMDATGFFHDLVPGANSAASNILALLMAARLVGQVDDETLGGLNNQIVFALFQAEAQGFVGSRSFFRDLAYPGFECNSDLVRAVPRLGEASEYACLNPLYPSVKFSDLGQLAGMLSLDQLGIMANDGYVFVHADEDNDDYGAYISQILQALAQTDSGFSVMESSASNNNNGNDDGNNDNNGFPYPPSPLTSLLSLSEGAVGGAVLTGYDIAYSTTLPYHSFRESGYLHSISLKGIAAAATIVARAAIAAAYDGQNGDCGTAAEYAADLIPELDEDNGVLVALANCFLYDGACADIHDYASTRARNEQSRSGFNIGEGASLGSPPNYYVGVYNGLYGQPFVQVGEHTYGRYSGDEFGDKNTDAVAIQPRMLENAVHGLLDDFLGRGSANFAEQKCKKQTDCQSVEFCEYQEEIATCTGGGVCVCGRAHFHQALDEALLPAKDKPTGYFEVSNNDPGVSPMYTEPYWSNKVGVRVYRDVGQMPGLVTLVAGSVGAAMSFCAAFLLRVGLKKEKLY